MIDFLQNKIAQVNQFDLITLDEHDQSEMIIYSMLNGEIDRRLNLTIRVMDLKKFMIRNETDGSSEAPTGLESELIVSLPVPNFQMPYSTFKPFDLSFFYGPNRRSNLPLIFQFNGEYIVSIDENKQKANNKTQSGNGQR